MVTWGCAFLTWRVVAAFWVVALVVALVVLAVVVLPAAIRRSPPLQTSVEKTIHDVLRDSIVQVDTGTSTGSGVVYDSRGDIVTNAHVVAGAKTVKVVRTAGAKPLGATVIGVSHSNDLAVIRVHSGADTLTPARFGNSDDVKIGEFVLAMGDPLGLTDSVTQGIVSSADRKVREQHTGAVLTVIQTSADINPGNSGGGLVDVNGRVVGMPVLNVYDPATGAAVGIGFAIPSNTVRRVAGQLIASARPK